LCAHIVAPTLGSGLGLRLPYLIPSRWALMCLVRGNGKAANIDTPRLKE